MKILRNLLLVTLVAFAVAALSAEERNFQVAEKPEIGESNAFQLSTTKGAVVKTEDGDYVVLRLLSSGREDGGNSYTETCALSWTLITPASVKSGIEHFFIRYRSEKIGKGSSRVERIAGSDQFEIGSVSLRWSYGSPVTVYLYPKPGTEYTTFLLGKEKVGENED
jgi:hypothetical protein